MAEAHTRLGATVPWKQLLLKAIDSNANLKDLYYLQLATVRPNGRPANRTVGFRGFLEGSDKIQINTDGRSRKIEDIKHCPFAEICWYFSDSREQFRINGNIDVIDGSNADPVKLQQRENAWFACSLKSQLQYLGPSPGLPYIREESPNVSHLDPSAGPNCAYCLLILDPEEVDYVNLKSNERLLFKSEKCDEGKSWVYEKVNP